MFTLWKMKNKLFSFLFVLLGFSLFGQFSVEDYLATPFREAEIAGLEKQMEYLDNESFRSPLFRELEIRLRSNDFNLSPEDYRLRLGFINPFERRANKSYNELQADYFESKYDYEVNLILANRYKQLIRHYYFTQTDTLLSAEIMKLVVTYEQNQTSNFSIKQLIDTDEKILKKELRRKEIQTSVEILENYFYEIHGITDSVHWTACEMIHVDKMKALLLADTIAQSKAFDLALKNFQMDEQAFKIEKAESYRNIGFFQAEYDTDRGKEFNDHMGFQLGISLPVFNPKKPQLQREKLELIESEHQLQQVKDESEVDRFNLNKKLLGHIWSYEVVEKRLKDFEALGRDITYDDMEDYLALINYLGNLRLLRNQIYLECINTYIDLLAMSGELSNSPFVNYISNE